MVFLNLVSEVHLDRKAQVTSLLIEKVKIPDEYSDFDNVFLEKKVLVPPERIKLNEHTINLEDGEQLPYRPIYSLGPVELETLKIYIKTHLKTGFIWPSKFFANAPILFNKKPNGGLCLCINY